VTQDKTQQEALSRRGVIFDGDDTLWETQSLYNTAKRSFFLEMEKAGFNPAEVERRFESIDHANVARLGFGRRRFPQSMCETYKRFCEEHSLVVDPGRLSQMRAIGESVFLAVPTLYKEAERTLGILRSANFVLTLATKGDPEIQRERIRTSGLTTSFDGIYVFEEKGAQEFRQIVDDWRLDIGGSWSIGNSARSDIAPALAIGLSGIWIRRTTWSYEDEELGMEGSLYVAASLEEACSIVLGKPK
jgi:putative hydrolase of the HAD superfamily